MLWQSIESMGLQKILNIVNSKKSAGMCYIFIDRKAREIMYLVASVRPSVRLSDISQLNRLTYDLDFWYGGRP